MVGSWYWIMKRIEPKKFRQAKFNVEPWPAYQSLDLLLDEIKRVEDEVFRLIDEEERNKRGDI